MTQKLKDLGINLPTLVTWLLIAISIIFQVNESYFKLNSHIADNTAHLSVEEITTEQKRLMNIEAAHALHVSDGHDDAVRRAELKEVVRQVVRELKQEGYLQ